jgi:hypothetical protein
MAVRLDDDDFVTVSRGFYGDNFSRFRNFLSPGKRGFGYKSMSTYRCEQLAPASTALSVTQISPTDAWSSDLVVPRKATPDSAQPPLSV